MLNVEPINSVFLKTCNTTKFDEIIIKFTEQNVRPLEIEDKVNLMFLINIEKCNDILEPRTTKYVKGYRFLLFARKYKKHYWIQH